MAFFYNVNEFQLFFTEKLCTPNVLMHETTDTCRGLKNIICQCCSGSRHSGLWPNSVSNTHKNTQTSTKALKICIRDEDPVLYVFQPLAELPSCVTFFPSKSQPLRLCTKTTRCSSFYRAAKMDYELRAPAPQYNTPQITRRLVFSLPDAPFIYAKCQKAHSGTRAVEHRTEINGITSVGFANRENRCSLSPW